MGKTKSEIKEQPRDGNAVPEQLARGSDVQFELQTMAGPRTAGLQFEHDHPIGLLHEAIDRPSHDSARVAERERNFVESGLAAQRLLNVGAGVRSHPDAGSICSERFGVVERNQFLLPEQSPAERSGLDRIRGREGIRVLEHPMNRDAEQAIGEGEIASSRELIPFIRDQIAS